MRSWYKSTIENFLKQTTEHIVSDLTQGSIQDGFNVEQLQYEAWKQVVDILKDQLKDANNITVFLEFKIPRMGKRIDAVLLIHSNKPHIVLLEFKIGQNSFNMKDIDQVTDYMLELKNFHLGSHDAEIFPVLVASEYNGEPLKNADVECLGSWYINDYIKNIDYLLGNAADGWEESPYKPTPTIIEAARALYANHTIDEITRSEAGDNIISTCQKINEIIEDSRENNKKTIIFVTGVPGAGKTLVGLNIASQKQVSNDGDHAVLLSGNGPLVNVLTEALARDDRDKNGVPIGKARNKVKSFIQIVHHYRDEYIKDSKAPSEHVAIFDEAQRAWDGYTITNWMNRKKRKWTHGQSESGFLISTMDRHKDWACIVCLVGGGQELKKGEAGIGAWIEAVPNDWQIAISPNIVDAEYNVSKVPSSAQKYDELHLSTTMRSFRSEKLSQFVKALLDVDSSASRIYSDLNRAYPIKITRDLKLAKQWVKSHAKGTERPGMLATSRAQRLVPFAIDINKRVNEIHYFLGDKESNKSSYFLEDAASEFVCQGLELDYSLLCWDADMRFNGDDWQYYNAKNSAEKGIVWQNNRSNKQESKNAYRVLLTRARQGMVIFIPNGNYPPDQTRKQQFYDSTYDYLKAIGIEELHGKANDIGY
jgi:hypothetical protein